MIETDQKYGVKIMIISPMDYADFNEIIEAVQSKGYRVTMNDNGTATCEKIRSELKFTERSDNQCNVHDCVETAILLTPVLPRQLCKQHAEAYYKGFEVRR